MGKRLGQHFLYDPKIAAKMCGAAGITEKDIVLEIGPGKGLITAELAKRAEYVVAVEKDPTLASALEGRFGNVKVIQGDILDIKWPQFDKIVSNIPFEISSPLLEKIFEGRKLAVLILQKEFAARLTAKPGDKNYSKLTVKCNYYCDAKRIAVLKPGAFRPAPKVTAVIVKLVPHAKPFHADEKFWETANALFRHKRKTVGAAFKAEHRTAVLPMGLAKKRVFQCDLQTLKLIAEKS